MKFSIDRIIVDQNTAYLYAPNEPMTIQINGQEPTRYLIRRIVHEPGRSVIELDADNTAPDIADQLEALSFKARQLTLQVTDLRDLQATTA